MLKLLYISILATLGLSAWTGPVDGRDASSELKAQADPQAVLSQRFEKEIWPLFTRGDDHSCVGCHNAENSSELHFYPEAKTSFVMLLEKNYFATNTPDSLLGRLTSTHPKRQMPKGAEAQPWTELEIRSLLNFAIDADRQVQLASNRDEQFPAALLSRYQGPIPNTLDNQFIGYRQLRGKIATIFHDDWVRNGRDLFQENLALFGGADFKERFNETTKASATFLSGMEMLSRDAAARAYTQKSGPFAGRADSLPSPLGKDRPDSVYAKEIGRLYQAILFRSPTTEEMKQSFALLQNIYRAEEEIQRSDFELAFDLIVEDESTGLRSTRGIRVPVSGETRGLYQELLDQSRGASEEADEPSEEPNKKKKDRKVSGKLAQHKLTRTFSFKANDPGQSFRLSNINTLGNVSFHSIEIQPVENPETNQIQRIAATNSIVQAEGAWKIEDRKGLTSFEDENNDKGNSTLVIPISVPREGDYEITVYWRQNADNADGVLAEVFSQNPDRLAKPSSPPVPPDGEAHYFIDQTVDTIAFADLPGSFLFASDDFVEINNKGTRNRVTADAVKFVADKDRTTFLVDNDEADGREEWKEYKEAAFEAYNKTGKNTFHDDNARKGELSLRYKPSLKTNSWKADGFYHVSVGYPAKKDHETHAPVVIKAQKSSPILQLAYPARARAGAEIEIDASASFTVQRSKLKFTWQQLDGPALKIDRWHEPILKFEVPRQSAPQIAWEGLCRALMRHPDFLFTRPPSVDQVRAKAERKRLQLVKIALDLAGRSPTPIEFERLARGASFEQMVDHYLQTQEFKDFYFHRVRLYLESHGTETQDEPARLWCYVVFNDRPFQEILTADYTVDTNLQKQPRPVYYGKTGVLTTHGFMEGKPGLPHFNYAAQVAELFLGYIFEVPPEVVAQRDGITAVATTDPNSLCYSCHKVLTPLAFQRNRWDDEGRYRAHDDYGLPIDDSDQKLVASYPYKGEGLEAFTTQAVKKERFIRTLINTHFTFYFGRDMRYEEDERVFYKRLWDSVHLSHFSIRSLIKSILTSPEYLEGRSPMLGKERIAKPKRDGGEKLRAKLLMKPEERRPGWESIQRLAASLSPHDAGVGRGPGKGESLEEIGPTPPYLTKPTCLADPDPLTLSLSPSAGERVSARTGESRTRKFERHFYEIPCSRISPAAYEAL